MAMFSYNEFDSLTVRDVSSSSVNPTIVYDGVDLPICGNITFVSIFVTNKSDSNKTINFSVRKMDDAQDTYLFYNVEVPPYRPYDILGGSKIFLKKEDVLKAWTDVSGTEMLDLVVSYVIYTPSDLQPI
jgi:hypothetical protein